MLECQPYELVYSGPTNVSQVLSPYSASPPKVLLSGFRSRCHIVSKGALPEFRVQQGLGQLIQLYTLAGFDRDQLLSIASQIQTSVRRGQNALGILLCPGHGLFVLDALQFFRVLHSQLNTRSCPCALNEYAMENSGQQVRFHLAQALFHLNQLVSLIPFF